jgi:hypothetical protein
VECITILRVGVGAPIKQQLHHLLVASLCRTQERRLAPLIPCVWVHVTLVQQWFYHGRMPLFCCQQQRCLIVVSCDLDPGSFS